MCVGPPAATHHTTPGPSLAGATVQYSGANQGIEQCGVGLSAAGRTQTEPAGRAGLAALAGFCLPGSLREKVAELDGIALSLSASWDALHLLHNTVGQLR